MVPGRQAGVLLVCSLNNRFERYCYRDKDEDKDEESKLNSMGKRARQLRNDKSIGGQVVCVCGSSIEAI